MVVYVEPEQGAILRDKAEEGRMSAEGAEVAALSLVGALPGMAPGEGAAKEADNLLKPEVHYEGRPVIHVSAPDLIAEALEGVRREVEGPVGRVQEALERAPGEELGCKENLPTDEETDDALSFDKEAVGALKGKAEGFLAELACFVSNANRSATDSGAVTSFFRAELEGLSQLADRLSQEDREAAVRLLKGALGKITSALERSQGKRPALHLLQGSSSSKGKGGTRRLMQTDEEESKVADPDSWQMKAFAWSIALILLAACIISLYCLFSMELGYDSLIFQSRIPEAKLD